MARKETAAVLQKKRQLVTSALSSRASASSSSLSASFGLPVEEVRRILQSKGVYDDG